jgi:hypothetical protein
VSDICFFLYILPVPLRSRADAKSPPALGASAGFRSFDFGFLLQAIRIRRHARHVMMMTMMAMNPHLLLKV